MFLVASTPRLSLASHIFSSADLYYVSIVNITKAVVIPFYFISSLVDTFRGFQHIVLVYQYFQITTIV